MHRRASRGLGLAFRASIGLAVLSGALALGWVNPHPVQAAVGPASSYVPLTANRILDTRVSGHPVGSNSTENLTVAGLDSVPVDATAVALNVTVSEPSSNSYLTVYPAGETTPLVSNLNFSAAETVTNLAIVAVGADDQVTIYNADGTVQVIIDLEGYFAASSGSNTTGSYVALTPARITDTRPGSGEPNSGDPIGPEGILNVQATGEGGIPTTGVAAVALNVTVTDPTQGSYLTAFPAGIAPVPVASNLNWGAAETVANLVIVPVGSNGKVSLFNALGTADILVDAVGYFTSDTVTVSDGSLYYPMSPIRLVDTRFDAGTTGPNGYLAEQLAGVDGISSTATAVVANLTATNASESSYFSVVPSQTAPATSNVNFSAGQTVPNLVIPTLNSDGGANVYNSVGSADAIVDVFGYFQLAGTPGPASLTPCTAASLNASVTASTQGTPVSVSAGSTCPSAVSYEYWLQSSYSSAWVLAQGWTSSDSYSYPTTNWAPGSYQLAVWASTGSVYQSASNSTSLTSDATVLVGNVSYSPQVEGMTCEEATLEMGLSHEGIAATQQQVLNAEGDNEGVPGIGPDYTRANPMVNFLGPPNGAEAAGYEPGAYYGAIVRAADALGGNVLLAGEGITPQEVYDYVDQGHPVEVWVTFDFHVDYGTTWLTDGASTWPWAGPDEHAVLIVGISNNAVEIDNPWAVRTYGAAYIGPDAWVPMSTFASVYAVYNDMAVVLN